MNIDLEKQEDLDIGDSFRCDVNGLETHTLIIFNGLIPSCVGEYKANLPWQIYQENETGIVVKVEKNVVVEKPLQIIFLCGSEEKLKVDLSIRVELAEKASITIVHCTDSDATTKVECKASIKIDMAAESKMSWLSLQNINDQCTTENDLKANLKTGSSLHTFFASLNGGELYNTQEINLLGKYAEAQVRGIYLVDGHQRVGNKVKINHKAANTKSEQLFKGVLDDSAFGWFEGHVFVDPEAQQTEAHQTNRNILLTPKARFKTKPFLEIYADDVKCSHGATIGQLDEEALFYMKCRGISGSVAKRLLMYAFAEEVISKIEVKALFAHLSMLVKRRLRGELGVCADCAGQCSSGQACNKLPWC